MPGRNLNLLCIDGGGIKGLSALCILAKLMELINPDDPPKPCHVFDMIGGPSTGGWIAIMLGRLEMSVVDCIEAFMQLQHRIFFKDSQASGDQMQYDHGALEASIKDIISSQGLDAEASFEMEGENACKVFVTATVVGPSTEILTSYYRPRGSKELFKCTKIWEAVRATSASADFFGPIEIGPAKRTFFDGGAGANNPVYKLWEEMQDLLGYDRRLEEELNCLISLGAGIKLLKPFDQTSGALLNTLMSIATETERSVQQFQRSKANLFREGVCYRFSAPSVGDLGMNKPEDRGLIQQITDRYIEDESTWIQLERCASTISRRQAKQSGLAKLHDRQLQLVRSGVWSMVRSKWTVNGLPFDIFDSMSKYDRDRALRRIRNKRCPGTAEWITKEPQFQQWLNAPNGSLLLLNGIRKTLCPATAIEHLGKLDTSENPQLFHFFFEMATQNCRDGVDALNALIKQMVLLTPDQEPGLRSEIQLYYGPTTQQPSLDEVCEYVFLPLIKRSKAPIVVVDGLDLCQMPSLTVLMGALTSAANHGARVFVSARGGESDALKRLQPALSEVKISKENRGVADDLARVVSTMVNTKRQQKDISSDHMFTVIQHELLNKVGVMLLWAKLLVDEIWKDCCDDASVKHYLSSRLPKDLEETYTRCLIRLGASQTAMSRRLLVTVCAAVEPFYLDELQHFLSLRDNSDSPISDCDKQPSRDTIVECGANLIVIDYDDDLVLPIHHSVIQHVTPGESRDTAEQKIGRLCLLYIESLGAIQKVKLARRPVARVPILPGLPLAVHKFLGSRSMIQGTLDVKSYATPPVRLPAAGHRSFLDYAQRAWLQSNRSIDVGCSHWAKFRSMALNPLTGVECPWPTQDSSWISHISGLFTWAVTQLHLPLLHVALEEGKSRRAKSAKLDLWRLPLTVEDMGSALHLAAKIGNEPVFSALYNNKYIMEKDLAGDTSLHVAAFHGHSSIVGMIIDRIEEHEPRKLSQFGVNARSQNLLHAAIWSKSVSCIRKIFESFPGARVMATCADSDGVFPLQLAARTGDVAFFKSSVVLHSGVDTSTENGRHLLTSCIRDIVQLRCYGSFYVLLEQYNHGEDLRICLEELLGGVDHTSAVKLIDELWATYALAIVSACCTLPRKRLPLIKHVLDKVLLDSICPRGIDAENMLRLAFECGHHEYFCLLAIRNPQTFLNAILQEMAALRFVALDIQRAEWRPGHSAKSASIMVREAFYQECSARELMELRPMLSLLGLICGLDVPELCTNDISPNICHSSGFSDAFHATIVVTQKIPLACYADLATETWNVSHGGCENPDSILVEKLLSLAADFDGNFTCALDEDVFLWLTTTQDDGERVMMALGNSHIDPNIRCDAGTTPLWQACLRGHLHHLPLLLAKGANPSLPNCSQFPRHPDSRHADVIVKSGSKPIDLVMRYHADHRKFKEAVTLLERAEAENSWSRTRAASLTSQQRRAK